MRGLRYAALAVTLLGLSVPLRADDKSDDAKTARAIVDKAIVAHGGADNLKKYPASIVKFKGNVQIMGNELPLTGEFNVVGLTKLKAEIEIEAGGQKILIKNVVNGNKGWVNAAGMEKELSKEDVTEELQKMHAAALAMLFPLVDGKDYTYATTGEQKIGENTTVGVRVSKKGNRDVTLYFDKTSHMLLKHESMVKDDMTGQEVLEETIQSDFKTVKGTKQAMKFKTKRDGKAFMDGEVTDIQLLETLEDNLFVKP